MERVDLPVYFMNKLKVTLITDKKISILFPSAFTLSEDIYNVIKMLYFSENIGVTQDFHKSITSGLEYCIKLGLFSLKKLNNYQIKNTNPETESIRKILNNMISHIESNQHLLINIFYIRYLLTNTIKPAKKRYSSNKTFRREIMPSSTLSTNGFANRSHCYVCNFISHFRMWNKHQ